MNSTSIKLLTLVFCAFFALQAQAQVTVGMEEAPESGALLQLKNKQEADNANADKGLLLPRVGLTEIEPTTPEAFATSINATDNWSLAEHVGLTVYNINTIEEKNICPGVYTWDGQIWQRLDDPCNTNLIVAPALSYACSAITATGADTDAGQNYKWYDASGTLLQTGGETYTAYESEEETDYYILVYDTNTGKESPKAKITIGGLAEGVFVMTDARDGNRYLCGPFGDPDDEDFAGYWMLENLRYVPDNTDPGFTGFTHSINHLSPTFEEQPTLKYFIYPEGIGDENPYVTTNHPSSDWHLYEKNGILYSWMAANNGENTYGDKDEQETTEGTDPILSPIRGICPEGWHLPSDKEWNDLEKVIFENAGKYSTYETGLGTWNPEPETSNWNHSTNISNSTFYRPATTSTEGQGAAMMSECSPYNNNINTDIGRSLSSVLGGFNALLVGYCNAMFGSDNIYRVSWGRTYFWTSCTSLPTSNITNTSAWMRRIDYQYYGVSRYLLIGSTACSVRCKKDSSTP